MKDHIFELQRKEWQNSGLNGIRTQGLCDTGAVLYQLSYQANWELVTLWVRNILVDGKEYKWVYHFDFTNCVVHNCDGESYLHIFLRSSTYMIFHIFTCIFTMHGYITNSQCDQLPVCVIAQLRWLSTAPVSQSDIAEWMSNLKAQFGNNYLTYLRQETSVSQEIERSVPRKELVMLPLWIYSAQFLLITRPESWWIASVRHPLCDGHYG